MDNNHSERLDAAMLALTRNLDQDELRVLHDAVNARYKQLLQLSGRYGSEAMVADTKRLSTLEDVVAVALSHRTRKDREVSTR